MPLHPQAQAFVQIIAQSNSPGWEEMSLAQARERFNDFEPLFGEKPAVASVENVTLGGAACRIYRDQRGAAPVVMYFHGGGFVLGNLETHDALCRRLAKQTGCIVISVDYRLAPEHRFPAALDDCYAATEEVIHRSDELKIDVENIVVAGDSAGGNLAAAVAIRARDQNGPRIALQVLIYPVISPHFETDSYHAYQQGHGLTRATMKWFWQQYLGDQAPTPLADLGLSQSLAGLPPAHVITAQYDVLCDEGEAYASRLKDAGVDVTTVRYDGMLHGFIHFAGIFGIGMEATENLSAVIRDQLVSS